MYSDIEGTVIGKCPGSINGQQFLIQNCKVCGILIMQKNVLNGAVGLRNISV